jgi:hypothetical protein
MSNIRLSALALAGLFITFTSSAQFADTVVFYDAGTGFNPGYNDPTAALGEPSRVTPGQFGGPVDPFNAAYLPSQVVSIGAGGSLTVHFNTPILNGSGSSGRDFNIFGNAGFVIVNGDYSGGGITDGSLYGSDATGTRVKVSADGVNFYTLNPSLAPMVDSYFPTDGSGDFTQPMNPALTGADFNGKDMAGIRALYAGSGGGAGYDISWAQDALGQSVFLPSISFVEVDVLGGNAEVDGFVAVPEPATGALAGLGALLLLFRNRRREA